MNIINRFFLQLVLLPRGIYQKMGVQTDHLTSILKTKLIMDDRRPTTLHQSRRNKDRKPVSLATVGTMVVSAVLGLLYLYSFSVGSDRITQLSFYFSMFFFMLSATLISDFTSVLIDVRDNYIILTRPVNDRTFVVARLLHIFIHVCKIVFPMSLPGFVYMVADTGWAGGLIFWVLAGLVTLFSIFFINAVYILILKLTTPQRFQSIISSIQIVFAIVIYASYQLVPRLVREAGLENFNISSRPGIVFYPLYWLACTWNVLFTLQGTTSQVIAAALGLLLPFLSLFIVVRYLAPSFNNKLAMINSSATAAPPVPLEKRKVQKRKSYPEVLAKLFTRGRVENMGFLFTWKMTARSRDFKIKVYPGIGYMLVLLVLVLFNHDRNGLAEVAGQTGRGKLLVIAALYFSSLLLTMAMNQMIYSEKFRASWIYFSSPVSTPGAIISGAARAVILKFYIPLVVFITVAGVSLAGISLLPNIILGLFNQLLIAGLAIYISFRVFPFSLHQDNNVKTNSFLRSMGTMFIVGTIAFGHFLIYNITGLVIICAALAVLATYLLAGSIRNTTWTAVKSRYNEE